MTKTLKTIKKKSSSSDSDSSDEEQVKKLQQQQKLKQNLPTPAKATSTPAKSVNKASKYSSDSDNSDEEQVKKLQQQQKLKQNVPTPAKATSTPAKSVNKASKSSSDSDSSDEEQVKKLQQQQKLKQNVPTPAKATSTPAKSVNKASKYSSDSDNSDEEQVKKLQQQQKLKQNLPTPAKATSTPAKSVNKASKYSSDSDSSDEEQVKNTQQQKLQKQNSATNTAKAGRTPCKIDLFVFKEEEEVLSSLDEMCSPNKKLRLDGQNESDRDLKSTYRVSDSVISPKKRKLVETCYNDITDDSYTTSTVNNSLNCKKMKNIPFQRVRAEEVDKEYLNKIGKNDFSFKKGAEGSWGEKAYNVLKNTRGKSFKHEKTKKKRGSYRGGKIDTNTYSIKFSDDEI